MRLTNQQVAFIKKATRDLFGNDAKVWLFGSRVDDTRRGGDVDLLVEAGEGVKNPTLLGAKLSAKVSRQMHGRRVDVVIESPETSKQPIHEIARREGIRL